MNSEHFLDAMAYIDEEWIEDVALLRRNPKSITVIWIRRVAVIAACIAITFVGVIALRGIFIPAFDGALPVAGHTESPESNNFCEYTDTDDGILAHSELCMAIRIDTWENGTATATVVEVIDAESAVDIHQSIEVYFADIANTTDSEESNTEESEPESSESYAPTEEDYPNGSVVYVWGKFDATASTPTFCAYRMSTTL